MYSSQSLRGSWWDSRKIEKKKKRKANGATEHLWHASYKSHISVVAGEEQHFGIRSSGKKKKEYKWQSDLCGWVKPHKERTSSHHTLHGNIHEGRVGLQSMMQCPRTPGAYWKHDSSTKVIFARASRSFFKKHKKKDRSLRRCIYLNRSESS